LPKFFSFLNFLASAITAHLVDFCDHCQCSEVIANTDYPGELPVLIDASPTGFTTAGRDFRKHPKLPILFVATLLLGGV
jgi:hypothetical protein